jgi:hypothetical protein
MLYPGCLFFVVMSVNYQLSANTLISGGIYLIVLPCFNGISKEKSKTVFANFFSLKVQWIRSQKIASCRWNIWQKEWWLACGLLYLQSFCKSSQLLPPCALFNMKQNVCYILHRSLINNYFSVSNWARKNQWLHFATQIQRCLWTV